MRSSAALLVATLFLGACSGGTGSASHALPHANSGSSVHHPPSTSSLTARLSLEASTVQVGRALHGVLVLVNATGRPVPYCQGVAEVGLAKPGLPFEPVEPASGCLVDRSPTIPPGQRHWPITVLTHFQTCTSGGNPTATTPRCLTGQNNDVRMPPLPPGDYHTVVVWHLSLSNTPAIDQVRVQVVR